jgi:hypothetical protein
MTTESELKALAVKIRSSTGAGSGIIIGPSLVLTAAHVAVSSSQQVYRIPDGINYTAADAIFLRGTWLPTWSEGVLQWLGLAASQAQKDVALLHSTLLPAELAVGRLEQVLVFFSAVATFWGGTFRLQVIHLISPTE